MHAFARRLHGKASKSSAKETKGLILNGGWRYDLMGWCIDTFFFRRQWRKLRQKTVKLARLQPGEQVLDVGCGTGTLAPSFAHALLKRLGPSTHGITVHPALIPELLLGLRLPVDLHPDLALRPLAIDDDLSNHQAQHLLALRIGGGLCLEDGQVNRCPEPQWPRDPPV
jgi:SAM-dependent methyltransferase